MNITMQNIERLTLEQIREFVEGSRTIGFAAPKREAVYEFLERVLKSQQYRRLSRGQKGIVRRFLGKMTGLSRAQLTRWIGRWMKTRRVQRKPVCRPSFPRRYTAADIALLAGVDAAHEDLSGPAVRRVVKREHEVFGRWSMCDWPASRFPTFITITCATRQFTAASACACSTRRRGRWALP